MRSSLFLPTNRNSNISRGRYDGGNSSSVSYYYSIYYALITFFIVGRKTPAVATRAPTGRPTPRPVTTKPTPEAVFIELCVVVASAVDFEVVNTQVANAAYMSLFGVIRTRRLGLSVGMESNNSNDEQEQDRALQLDNVNQIVNDVVDNVNENINDEKVKDVVDNVNEIVNDAVDNVNENVKDTDATFKEAFIPGTSKFDIDDIVIEAFALEKICTDQYGENIQANSKCLETFLTFDSSSGNLSEADLVLMSTDVEDTIKAGTFFLELLKAGLSADVMIPGCVVKKEKFGYEKCTNLNSNKKCAAETLCVMNKETDKCAHVCDDKKKKDCKEPTFKSKKICKFIK